MPLDCGRTPRGICRTARDPGPTCNYYESWFEWDNSDHRPFQDAFRESLWRIDDPYGVQWTILVHDVRVRLYYQMGLNGPKTTISHINSFCKNREFTLKPHSYHYLFYCERFHLFVSIFTRRMGCSCFSLLESNFPPINFQESHLQDPRDLLGAWTFTKT